MSEETDIVAALRKPYGLAADARCEPLGAGLINRTLLLHSGERRLVVQRINRQVFPRPQAVVDNALAIEAHLRGQPDYPLQITRHLPDSTGCYLHGPMADIRVMAQLEHGHSLQCDPSPQQARRAARVFGQFAAALADLEPARLQTVIPDFHKLSWRLQQFERALAKDTVQRAASCAEEIDSLHSQRGLEEEWLAAVSSLPLRICHNDAKLDNLLWHRDSGEALAVIDLDTCMPGHLMTDFGDLVRSCSSRAAEDSPDVEAVHARPELLRALAQGYLEGLGPLPDAAERRSLALGARLLPYLQALRFLTDYLDGDRYYGAAYPLHNLHRARNQLALYRSLCRQRPLLEQLTDLDEC